MKTWAKAAAGAAAALATFAVLFWGRSFFAGHAALVAIAVGALVYTTLGTTERLRRMYGRKGPRSVRRRGG
ncbi:MAG TPA: hypothetical protein VLF66_00350 [Thermoanaerobaculia bacterium]|nr:hypothetical protein [Thermoanaerobaculia bacterium]